MTFILDVIAGLAAGLALAWAARAPLARTAVVSRTRYFAACAVYALCVNLPLALGTYLVLPDWFLMYVVNPGTASGLVLAPLVVLCSAAAPLVGFLGGHRILAEGRAELVRSGLYALCGLAVVAILVGARALSTLAYYEAYHYRGEVGPLVQSPVFAGLMLGVVARAGVFAYVYRAVAGHVARESDVGDNVPIRAEALPIPPPATETRSA